MNYFSNLFYIFVGLLKNDSMMIPDHFKLGRIATGVFRLFMVVGSKLMLTHAHKLRYNETILVVFNPPIGSIWQIIPPGGVNGFTSWAMKNTPIASHDTSWLANIPVWVVVIPNKLISRYYYINPSTEDFFTCIYYFIYIYIIYIVVLYHTCFVYGCNTITSSNNSWYMID